ncbi:hypothetical protein EMIHUDRAFT_121185 [Emiliania huxleyi CCMP1516]|uniref:Uncharacterized protein n=2 Tax=Emiliania huxleyi TaxID=2903 RepID=A0A0D3I6E3_EMIH1|nr:hypothetical protein EMIHUDRAFT_121185 [Emiliania huxleyi CCMP1516]EOD06828.1 hypothetical protein EMIHUDRAFT_121185 [Emiliania huxleyi CCMP1516]|eukprot:XP_005759257.1 hypothetical protein EMIHUDRAFT_121185 [Emiliania huxleyi CCMP1516]
MVGRLTITLVSENRVKAHDKGDSVLQWLNKFFATGQILTAPYLGQTADGLTRVNSMGDDEGGARSLTTMDPMDKGVVRSVIGAVNNRLAETGLVDEGNYAKTAEVMRRDVVAGHIQKYVLEKTGHRLQLWTSSKEFYSGMEDAGYCWQGLRATGSGTLPVGLIDGKHLFVLIYEAWCRRLKDFESAMQGAEAPPYLTTPADALCLTTPPQPKRQRVVEQAGGSSRISGGGNSSSGGGSSSGGSGRSFATRESILGREAAATGELRAAEAASDAAVRRQRELERAASTAFDLLSEAGKAAAAALDALETAHVKYGAAKTAHDQAMAAVEAQAAAVAACNVAMIERRAEWSGIKLELQDFEGQSLLDLRKQFGEAYARQDWVEGAKIQAVIKELEAVQVVGDAAMSERAATEAKEKSELLAEYVAARDSETIDCNKLKLLADKWASRFETSIQEEAPPPTRHF